MNRKQAKKNFNDGIKKLITARYKTDHMAGVVNGFNFFVEKKAVVINGTMIHLYKELWGSNPATPPAWMQNAYIYLRMKHDLPEVKTVYFRDIETDRIIGRYENGKGIVVE